MEGRDPQKIEMRAIGFVNRTSRHENDRDRSLIAKVVLDEALAPALDGIEDWSHIYVIFWLDRVRCKEEPDAYDETPVLDIKPYPDWEHDLIVVTDFRVPEWLRRIIEQDKDKA